MPRHAPSPAILPCKAINDHCPTFSEGTTETALEVGADDSVTYTAPDGGTYKFVPTTGGGWTRPAGLNSTITTFSATAVTLRFNDSGETNFYQNVGEVFRLAHAGHHYRATLVGAQVPGTAVSVEPALAAPVIVGKFPAEGSTCEGA
ncbi:hypothetical protein [Paeniglutamicibacter sulfureus]|uniref:Uncharacterized protein n=1 Tax=Paeniglutamicibacter sulfureus TaxID=43666 RepID=A0ABU2BLH8_9MICC|nr:hypothetical protein [Paeniglutamicibacter sulfureus]MDO2935185.1 hypothetical protein [Paeniglutamicibacter sulfureus]MDR7359498.1 hypothetical protein [Paeniglutamicibacter sulfureus]